MTAIRPVHKILMVCASLLVTGGLLELGLRVAGVVYTGSFYTGDIERGWALRPEAEGWDVTEAKEYIQINSDGLRDREHPLEKPMDTLRIAVLGDSYAEALNVPMEKAFWSVLERQISSCPNLERKRVEVINFGVSGYGTAQEFLTLPHVWKYSPDIVLLAFYAGNDLFNNFRSLNDPGDADNTPYFVYRGEQLVLDDSFRNSWKLSSRAYRWFFDFRGNLQNHVRLVQVLMEGIRDLKLRSARQALAETAAGLDVGDREDLVYREPSEPRMNEAWRATEGLLRLMSDEVRAHGAELWIATLANRAQLLPEESQRRAFLDRLGIDTPFYPDLRLRAFAERAGIPIVTLAIPMAAYAEDHHVFLNGGQRVPLGSGHWNETGHRVAGEILAAELCSGPARLSATGAAAARDSGASAHPVGATGARGQGAVAVAVDVTN